MSTSTSMRMSVRKLTVRERQARSSAQVPRQRERAFPTRLRSRQVLACAEKREGSGRRTTLSEGLMRYDAFLLDQFGVLHDGQVPYPGALRLVKELYEAKKRLVILSNSSRRSTHTYDRLAKMGFDPTWFAGAITSGDVAFRVLNVSPDEIQLEEDGGGFRSEQEFRLLRDVGLVDEKGEKKKQKQKQKGEESLPLPLLNVLHLTWSARGADDGFAGSIDLDGMPRVKVVNTPQEADVILIHGTEAQTQRRANEASGTEEDVLVPLSETDLENLLQECSKVDGGIPMLVANPDEVTVSGDKLVKMPGFFAVLYHTQMKVPMEKIHLLGKPNQLMYEMASELFLEGVERTQVLAVGDSLNHDIRGANDFGVDSLFITSGIHSDAFPRDLQQEEEKDKQAALLEALQSLCEKYRVAPTMYGTRFE